MICWRMFSRTRASLTEQAKPALSATKRRWDGLVLRHYPPLGAQRRARFEERPVWFQLGKSVSG